MTIYEFFSLMGGVGLFLYGMSEMSTGLKNAAGDNMRVILEHATSNRIVSVIVGVVVTLLIQSSSATDMMVISFVNSSLMTLSQAIGVIMGANIGTTITAQITAFNLGAYAPMILFIGSIMYLFLKDNTIKHIGSIIMGFGMLFFGISVIKGAIAPLSESQEFINFLLTLSNPFAAVLFGVLFTALLQSSSSSVVIFQTFAAQGLIGFEMTVYLVIGAAIGSVTPNILAALTTNRNGKRTAVLNLLFNLVRAVLIVILINIFKGFLPLIQSLTPDSISHQVANAHTIFAVIAVITELPFASLIVKASEKIIPLDPEESRKTEERKLIYLVQETGLPSYVMLREAKLEISRMGKIARDSLQDSIECFFSGDEKLAKKVFEAEETVDILTAAIQKRLVSFRAMDYSQKVLEEISNMILVVSDMERISDHAENIAEYRDQLQKGGAVISDRGMKDLRRLSDAAMRSIDMSLAIFETESYGMIAEAEKLEQQVDDIQEDIIGRHIERFMETKCDPLGGVVFTDLSTDLERCSDHAVNIAVALSGTKKRKEI